jgi:hypothetical protein
MHSILDKAVYAISRLLILLALASSSVWAQPAPDDESDLPVPARLSVVEGTVSFWRSGDQDWSPAQVNMALAAGDSIYASDGATVEIQIGPKAFVRLMAGTQLNIVREDVGLLQVGLASGNASFDLRSLAQNQLVEIDTPNAAFSVNSNGYYRVDFRDDTTRFVVRRNGRATLGLSDGYNRTVAPGEQLIVRGIGPMTAEVAAAPVPDSWDRWNDARTDYYDKAISNRYLPQQVYGAADLDQYGSWSDAPDYGTVWYPTVAAGWAPYSVGFWRWDPVYEWTWVDQAPWGWAPSHYGRWVSISGRWAWVPGPRVARPVYLPAVVAFVGFGGGPQVGWVALSWGEPVVPWWGHHGMRGRPYWGGWGGPRVVNNTVIQHNATININTISYRNSQVSHGVVAVRQEEFGRGHERRDPDHHFRFATPEDGRPAPIQGVLPMRRERAAVTAAPPVTPLRGSAPVVREAVPAQRGSVSGSAATVTTTPPQMHRESHSDSRFPSPLPAATPAPPSTPQTVIRSAPVPNDQPRVVEQHRVERHEGRPVPESTRVEVSPPHQEAPPSQRSVTIEQTPTPAAPPPTFSRQAIPQAPAPARETHSIEAPRRVEPAEPRREQHRQHPDDQHSEDSGQPHSR